MQIKLLLYLDNNLKWLFDSNNFTSVLNVFFPKCVAHEDKSCVYIF